MNEKVIILFGAGASVHAGISSTAQITDGITSYPLKGACTDNYVWFLDPKYNQAERQAFKVPINPMNLIKNKKDVEPNELRETEPFFQAIFNILKKQFQCPNFEHILAALEELQALLQSQSQLMADEFKSVLAPFVQTEDLNDVMQQPTFLWAARRVFAERISQILQRDLSAKPDPGKEIGAFINQVHTKHPISIFTLNYDDLVERAGIQLEDGFKDCHSEFVVFNRQHFLNAVENRSELFCHLHGSIRFGYSHDTLHHKEIVRYDNPDAALKSIEYGTGPDKIVKGDFVSGHPIISGFNKIAKLVYSPIPYGYYYRALETQLLQCPRLIVAGYGGIDDHVNTLLQEFIAVHGKARRIILITKIDIHQLFEPELPSRLMVEFASPHHVREDDLFWFCEGGRPKEWVEAGKYLRVMPSGFPPNPETIKHMLDFLES